MFRERPQALEQYFHALIRGEQRGLGAAVQRGGLRLASAVYGLGVRLRNWAYDRGWCRCESPGVAVVSVGNLTLGGTGKTPCVELVARFFRQRDCRVAILSRGYGVDHGRNDEALVLEENLPDVPHLQGEDRVALARIAVEELDSEVLVLDDGFQHRRLRRDLDLVLLDATCPWGYGALFPRGLLREPRRSLHRADMVLLTRCDQVAAEDLAKLHGEVRHHGGDVPVAECIHQPAAWVNTAGDQLPPAEFRGRPTAAFCGLGNPAAFRRTLVELGLEVVAWRTFPDHHGYTRADVAALEAWVRSLPRGSIVATTQKDLVKLRLSRLADKELWALRIELAVRRGREELERRLAAVLTDTETPSVPSPT
ncbi:MAG: tetraacyldisaccharide 4'-kinase [Gemmataceae bacterium]|nr:tetraacyldisaccharide 4'-kinase [Gemmataceae bacterium]